MLDLKGKHWVSAIALLALAGCATPATQGVQTEAARASVIYDGQKIVMATHSFNVFISPLRAPDGVGPLNKLAAEGGKTGQEFLAVQMIGGSTPMQHWNQGDGDESKNIAKAALREHAGEVDVFTMSPNAIMPEDGIDLFGDLVIETNPQARILVQNNWSGWDGNGTTAAVGGRMEDITFVNADRDKTTDAMIDKWLSDLHAPGGYLERMRTQLEGIDERAGRQITYVVPSADAVYTLRKLVNAGKVPGVEKQSDLFRDPIGHPKDEIVHLVSYVWYAMVYHESPVGMMSFVDDSDPTSAARERLLQEIAWAAVLNEPKSGVSL